MNAAQIADQAIAKMEAEDAGTLPADDNKDKGSSDANKGADAAGDASSDSSKAKDTKSTDDKGDKGSGSDNKGDGDASGADSKKSDGDKPGEFTAEDALEVETPHNQEPKAPTDNAGTALSAGEQKHIVENIGEPIVLRGIQGEGDNAKEVEIKAYSPTDIPANFKFANDAQMMAAQNGFQRLEQKANQLLGTYRNEQSQTQASDFERRENEGIRLDVADLQKEGLFPKFRVKPGDKGFDDTPEAKQMAEVLNLMTERNETYLSQYNQGRPYKHIGFREAYEIWERSNPDRQADRKATEDQKAEDAQRKRNADRTNSNRGTTSTKVVKPTIRSGTTINDILNAHEMDD